MHITNGDHHIELSKPAILIIHNDAIPNSEKQDLCILVNDRDSALNNLNKYVENSWDVRILGNLPNNQYDIIDHYFNTIEPETFQIYEIDAIQDPTIET